MFLGGSEWISRLTMDELMNSTSIMVTRHPFSRVVAAYNDKIVNAHQNQAVSIFHTWDRKINMAFKVLYRC